MIPYPRIDPEIFRIGPLAVRWYGMMYVLGFASSYFLVLYQLKKKAIGITKAQIDDIYFYLVLGLLAGARLGYVVFYNLPFYLTHPWEIFVLWHGGMSFHGGAIGTFVLGYWAMKRRGIPFLRMADLIIPTAPLGLFFGRMGNFINGELYGKPTTVPWGMVFPGSGNVPRHPSQLYEAALEGLLLFAILWIYKDRKKREGEVFAVFLICYAIFRTFCEFFREPDVQVGYILGFLTMGQLLSLVMLAIGVLLKFVYLPRLDSPPAKKNGGKGTGR
ncbi:MAG: Prolipoprotein diacylglyceryl transferase [Syntrophorhabdaceae bacterium PtaU1.Bin034]|nr:MAG: Prolipoprotein diacylglyceryl transferase [Syntrophorhabdaceae bacterium PtaU1.Bin034]